jgi:polysaccharide pyruvyl transferase WcaK-like protein
MSRNGIYLYGYYGQGNLGDDLLMISAVRMIRAARADAMILVHCHDAARLPNTGDPLIVPIEASAILADQSSARATRLLRFFRLLDQSFNECDVLVFGGGTVLQESRSPLSLLMISAMVSLARWRGLDVILLGAGLGEIRTRLGGFAVRHILRRVRLAAFRDEESALRAQQLFAPCPVVRTADLVYALGGGPQPDRAAGNGAVALSIQPSVTERSDALGQRARETMRGLVQALLQQRRRVRLLVFENKRGEPGGIDDGRAWRSLLGGMIDSHPGQLTLMDMQTLDGPTGTFDADTIAQRLFEDCSIHAGMRFHGHVLASQARLPFVGLSHDTKITEICRLFDMPCVSIDDSSTEDVLQALTDASKRSIADETLRKLTALSLENRNVIATALRRV